MSQPFFMPLFTGVRGMGILGSSLAGSCIDPPLRCARMASTALHAAWQRSTYCGGGWICREMDAPAVVITLAVVCTGLPDARSDRYIRSRIGPSRLAQAVPDRQATLLGIMRKVRGVVSEGS
jgi:hypothetical protein